MKAAIIILAAPIISAANWIPPRCCYQNDDCVRISASDVHIGGLFYYFTYKGKSYKFPIKDTIFSEDSKYYACFPGKLTCFSAPQMEF